MHLWFPLHGTSISFEFGSELHMCFLLFRTHCAAHQRSPVVSNSRQSAVQIIPSVQFVYFTAVANWVEFFIVLFSRTPRCLSLSVSASSDPIVSVCVCMYV
uniref:Uncharacterized protein n=1 Tax=Sphaerodactylus townsendi TaxID=933632 RepID=A0ACB8G5V3_9SAUR